MYKTQSIKGFKVYSSVKDPSAPIIYILRGGNHHYFVWSEEQIQKSCSRWNARGFSWVAYDYPDYDEYGGKEHEVIVEMIKNPGQFGSNAKNVGVFAMSRGGIHAYKILRDRINIDACVIMSSPTDMKALFARRPELRDYIKEKGFFDVENDSELYARSAIKWKINTSCPLLIIHGKQDENVDISHTKNMEKILKAEYRYFDGGHGLKGSETGHIVSGWFEKYLK